MTTHTDCTLRVEHDTRTESYHVRVDCPTCRARLAAVCERRSLLVRSGQGLGTFSGKRSEWAEVAHYLPTVYGEWDAECDTIARRVSAVVLGELS